jgi:hypothetical protein
MENTEMADDRLSQEALTCIRQCQDTHAICLQTLRYDLNANYHGNSGRMVESGHMRLLLDCADMCQTHADMLLRTSSFANRAGELCAEVCQACAEDCERFGEDRQSQDCATACRQAAASCRRMLAAA